jgi:CubicO group peptidase (beta-lactamase class C family)
MSGLQIRAEDLLKIGQLILNQGIWHNKRILSKKWLQLSMNPEPLSDRSSNGINYKCGLLWWLKMQPTIYFADGYLGQYLIIIPEKNIVAVRQIHEMNTSQKSPENTTFREFIDLVAQLDA